MPSDPFTLSATDRRLARPRMLNRRRLIGGIAGMGATGALAGCGFGGGSDPTATVSAPTIPVTDATEVATPLPDDLGETQGAQTNGESVPTQATPEEVQQLSQTAPASEGVLVTSPRLPLRGIGGEQAEALLADSVSDWADVGSPMSVPVEAVGVVGSDGYDDVVPQLDDGLQDFSGPVGRVAQVPLAAVDFRVNVLSVNGVDPLRDRSEGENGPITHVAIAGDIVPGRNVHLTMERYGDFQYPFRQIADRLSRYDITIANLEGNISDTLPNPVFSNPNTIDFVTGTAFLDGFASAGIDAVTLGNNHSHFNESSWGSQGLLDTMAALDAFGLPYFGGGSDITRAREPFVTEVNGISFAFLGHDGVTANLDYAQDRDLGVVAQVWGAAEATPGTNPYSLDQFSADVAAAAGQYDVVIPYLHAGAEFKWVVPEWVVQASRAAVDAGASVVVTNHPHIIQGMEVYNGVPIVYSLGNFIFDQMFSVDTRQGLILDLTFDGAELVGLRLDGVEIQDFCQPRLMTAPEQAAIMDRFWRSADRLAGR